MIKRYKPNEFVRTLKNRGYARRIDTAKKYVKAHPKKVYTEEDFRDAYDWLETEEKAMYFETHYCHATPEDLTIHRGSQFNPYFTNGLHNGRLYPNEDVDE